MECDRLPHGLIGPSANYLRLSPVGYNPQFPHPFGASFRPARPGALHEPTLGEVSGEDTRMMGVGNSLTRAR